MQFAKATQLRSGRGKIQTEDFIMLTPFRFSPWLTAFCAMSSGSPGLALRGQGLSQVRSQSLPTPGQEIKLSEAGEAAP